MVERHDMTPIRQFPIRNFEGSRGYYLDLGCSLFKHEDPKDFLRFFPDVADWMARHRLRLIRRAFSNWHGMSGLFVKSKSFQHLDLMNEVWAPFLIHNLVFFRQRERKAPMFVPLIRSDDLMVYTRMIDFTPHVFGVGTPDLKLFQNACTEWAREAILRKPFLLTYTRSPDLVLRFCDEADLVHARLAGLAVHHDG